MNHAMNTNLIINDIVANTTIPILNVIELASPYLAWPHAGGHTGIIDSTDTNYSITSQYSHRTDIRNSQTFQLFD